MPPFKTCLLHHLNTPTQNITPNPLPPPNVITSYFTLFPSLPAELQLQIWELAAGPGPTLFVVSGLGRLPRPVPANRVEWTGAALLATCRASRAVATRICTYRHLRILGGASLTRCTKGGSNVRHAPSPADCWRPAFTIPTTVDLATSALFWPYAWQHEFDAEWPRRGFRFSTIVFRHEDIPDSDCGNNGCICLDSLEAQSDYPSCVQAIAMRPATMKDIRRVMLLVEDFGVVLAGTRRAPGPVYTSTSGMVVTYKGLDVNESPDLGFPEGAEFYDVTDGLVDVATGRPLFDIWEGMLERLEAAREILKLVEERWLEWKSDEANNEDKNRDVAFRILVGVERTA